ncbi:hypothetical protein GUJ93_ZPchr0010g7673 [Zizania palustris]|uniref:Dof-type domain-containing protein n=1 Tax=Zizania palustris TaxID=103762 RepID=A0A8J6BJA1_ZIZPA|nr:hypothetical protein GUJ93_ZPchr0010g7673 [Zizania palustris]
MGECGGRGGGEWLIKLFGKTIPVPEAKDLQQHSGGSSLTESNAQETVPREAGGDPSPQSEVVDGEDPVAAGDDGDGTQTGDAASQREKLKKPDKILPCPRCSSMDTKFCYFNNYNVNQPRHFCKNCQRYWTAGGAMRNVPVGAGRRKNKNAAAAHFLERVRAAAAMPGAGDAVVNTNGRVLSFGHDAPAAVLDLAGQMAHLKERLIVPAGRANNPSAGSCSEVSSNTDDRNPSSTAEKSANGVQLQQHPSMDGGAIWPYSCAPSPAYFTSGIAIPVYPAAPAYWGCMVPGAWSLPWLVQPQSQALSSPTRAPPASSGPNSSTLGKHPREGADEGRDGHGNGKVTIRIDNADEVARSSIRSLFGFKGDNEEADTGVRHKLATVFEPKRDAKTAKHTMITSSPLLHANPVALTRSATFQEGS